MNRLLVSLMAVPALLLAGDAPKTKNIVLITFDGVRLQEIFGGIDPVLMKEKEAGMRDPEPARGRQGSDPLRKQLWAETAEARREKLLPFFWKTLAPQGVVLGNVARGSAVEVTNRFRVSYPGYTEILTCRAQDDRVQRNDPIPDPTPLVFEFLSEKLRLARHQAAVFASWEMFRHMQGRKGTIFVNAGYDDSAETPRMAELSGMQAGALTPSPNDEVRPDAFTVEMALEYVKKYKPRALYLSLSQTDSWAHAKRYDRVLQSLRYFDRSLERLWTTLQSMPEYRGRTSIVISTDHGRGVDLKTWSGHGSRVEAARNIWIAAAGPDTPSRGEAADTETAYQRDISATLLALAGVDWTEFCRGGGKPIAAIAGR